MNYRDYLQQLIYKIINPLIRGMIKIGITPNFITTTGRCRFVRLVHESL